MNHGPTQTTSPQCIGRKGCQMDYTRKDRTQSLILYHYYNTPIKQYEYNASVNCEN